MPQPKKPVSPAPRKATATKPKAAAKRKPAGPPRTPPAAPAVTPLPTSPDELAANLGALRERLVSSLTITTDRLQDAVDDAVRRGRMTRRDAEDLLATLVTAGRAQTEALLADVEQLLGRGSSVRARATGSGDAVLRTVDRARRRVGGTFPILGYDDLTAAQITARLGDLTPAQLRKVRDHERRHDARKSVLAAVERKLG
jgi:polyhydroxyalkanoate synthesis regulator phasin